MLTKDEWLALSMSHGITYMLLNEVPESEPEIQILVDEIRPKVRELVRVLYGIHEDIHDDR